MTDKKLKSIPRLTFIFIITMVISGSILTYFSINNISNFKELTQKKISEEQEDIVEQVSEIFHDKLEECTREYDKRDFGWAHDTSGAIIETFALNRDGAFLKPFFPGEFFKRPVYNQSISYMRFINLGENAEHQEENMAKARRYYETSLKHAINEVDTANSLNAMARVAGKLKHNREARTIYSKIINSHFSVLHKAGIPYSYIAVSQLIKQDELNRDSLIYDDVLTFLLLMESGKIPLTVSSLDDINEWILQATVLNQDQKSSVIEPLDKIRKQLDFYNEYSEVIREKLKEQNDTDKQKIFDQYNVYQGIRKDRGDLIVINTSGDTIKGIIIDIEGLWNITALDVKDIITEFQYEINMIGQGESEKSTNILTTTEELSPYFQSHVVEVGLMNENIVDEYISQRSWIYGIALILLLGGMLLGLSLILRDIRRENNLAALRADFVSNVTHELKTPLTSISMFAESIYQGGVLSESDQKKYSNVILKESGNLKRMINNILTFSMREDGKQNYQIKENNLSEIVKSTIDEFSYWLEKHKFRLTSDIQNDIVIKVDSEAFKQALANLINNAIKYSPLSKSLTVRLFPEDKYVILEVEDSGIGIPQDQIAKIFNKFYRVRSKDTDSTSGTGIGLTVTKDIIEAHGGTIEVSSKLDVGSTFRIKLKA